MLMCKFNKVALHSNFIEIALRHGCSPVNLLHNFRTPFSRHLWVAASEYRMEDQLKKLCRVSTILSPILFDKDIPVLISGTIFHERSL